MKQTLYILLLLFTMHVSAQSFKGAVNLGVNATQVDGDMVYGFNKFGINAGPSAILPLGKFFASIETLFNQKGAYQKADRSTTENPDSGEYRLHLNYAEVPVLVHFTDKDIITIGTGFSWGKLVSVKEWEHGRETVTNIKSNTYNRNDWNILVDLRFKCVASIFFNFRYAYSLHSLRTRTFLSGITREQYNNSLTCRLIWIINEKGE